MSKANGEVLEDCCSRQTHMHLCLPGLLESSSPDEGQRQGVISGLRVLCAWTDNGPHVMPLVPGTGHSLQAFPVPGKSGPGHA